MSEGGSFDKCLQMPAAYAKSAKKSSHSHLCDLSHSHLCGLSLLFTVSSANPVRAVCMYLYSRRQANRPTNQPFQMLLFTPRTKTHRVASQVECTTCRRNFCFKHRHEEDHKCEATAAASRREHPHLQKRGVGKAAEVPKGKAAPVNPVGKPAAGAAGEGRPCGTEAGEAAAMREREARAGGGAGAGAGIAAR